MQNLKVHDNLLSFSEKANRNQKKNQNSLYSLTKTEKLLINSVIFGNVYSHDYHPSQTTTGIKVGISRPQACILLNKLSDYGFIEKKDNGFRIAQKRRNGIFRKHTCSYKPGRFYARLAYSIKHFSKNPQQEFTDLISLFPALYYLFGQYLTDINIMNNKNKRVSNTSEYIRTKNFEVSTHKNEKSLYFSKKVKNLHGSTASMDKKYHQPTSIDYEDKYSPFSICVAYQKYEIDKRFRLKGLELKQKEERKKVALKKKEEAEKFNAEQRVKQDQHRCNLLDYIKSKRKI